MSIAELIKSDPLLDEDQAAEFIGTKPQTLSVWRCTKRYNLPYVKVGRLVRYRLSDLRAFLAANTVGASADSTAGEPFALA